MESNDEALFREWLKTWEQFVDFELYPIDGAIDWAMNGSKDRAMHRRAPNP
jgi:hypothetical protein